MMTTRKSTDYLKKARAYSGARHRSNGLLCEKDPKLYEHLKSNTHDLGIPVRTHQGDFRQYIDEIAELAQDRTVFLYLDPFRRSDLLSQIWSAFIGK